MAERYQYVPVGISQGVDTKLDPRFVAPPKVIDATNVSYRTIGAVSHRYGTDILAQVGTGSAAYVASTNDELLGADATNLYAHSPATQTFNLRGSYGASALVTRTIVQQTVNQNFTYLQAGGVRNLTYDIVGDVGIAVWDTGCNYTGGVPTLGTVYVCCFDATTGRSYWVTTTQGYAPTPSATAAYRLTFYGTNAAQPTFSGSPIGAAHPVVVAYKGKWVIGFLTAILSTTNVTSPAVTLNGYAYVLSLIYLTPSGTGVPAAPTIANGGSGFTALQSAAMPFLYNQMPFTLGTVQAEGIFDETNHFFDICTNSVDIIVVSHAASCTNAGTMLSVTAESYAYMTANDVSGLWNNKSTGNLPLYNGTVAYPFPLTVAGTPENSRYFICYQHGVQAVGGASAAAVFGTPMQHQGMQQLISNATYGLFTWPAAAGMTGRSNAWTATVTNGQIFETWTNNGTGLVPGPAEPNVSAPMVSLAQLPYVHGGMSTVASRMYYTPVSSVSTVYDAGPAVYQSTLATSLPAGVIDPFGTVLTTTSLPLSGYLIINPGASNQAAVAYTHYNLFDNVDVNISTGTDTLQTTAGFVACGASYNNVTAGGTTLASSSTHAWQGTYSLFVTTNGSAGRHVRTSSVTVSPSSTYTFQVFMRGNSAATLRLRVFDQTSAVLANSTPAVLSTSAWALYSLTFVTTVSTTAVQCFVEETAVTVSSWYMDGYQLINQGSPQSWSGGSQMVMVFPTLAANVGYPAGTPIVYSATTATPPNVPATIEPTAWLYAMSPEDTTPTNTSGVGAFSNTLLVHLKEREIMARAHYLRTMPPRKGSTQPPKVVAYQGGYWTAALYLQNVADNLVALRMVGVVPTQNRSIVPLPQGALLTGADTKYYDGQVVRSMGWQRLPELDHTAAVAVNTLGGLLLPNTQYTYYLVYVDYDAYGNALYSSPSPAYTVTTGPGDNSVRLDVQDLFPGVTGSTTGTAVQVYRNSATHPNLYYRVAILPTASNLATIFWFDTSAEDNSGNILLYSPPDGGELANDPPPPSVAAVASKSRVLVASAENRGWVYPSKPFYAGRGPEFNAGQFLEIDATTGDIVGLAVLDENFVIFKRQHIYLLSGQGPDATGNGVFNPTANISTDTGLLDPASIVSAAEGVYFRSQRGIQLLTRGFAVQYVGGPVDAYLRERTITSAIIVPAQHQVRFGLDNGTILVYDYTAQAWTVYVYALAEIAAGIVHTSQTLFQGAAYMGVSSALQGRAYKESEPTAPTFTDGSTVVPLTVQTAWIPVAGAQGWGRVRRANILGECRAASTLTIQFLYDYGVEGPPIIYTTTPGPLNIRVRATRQVCQAVAVRIIDTPAGSDTAEGCAITGIVLETSIKSGAARLPDSASV